jgi:hypothetical protein
VTELVDLFFGAQSQGLILARSPRSVRHRGAMMELGEGLCKLRKLRLDKDDGEPFIVFRDEVAAVLHFLYCTQKELAACN